MRCCIFDFVNRHLPSLLRCDQTLKRCVGEEDQDHKHLRKICLSGSSVEKKVTDKKRRVEDRVFSLPLFNILGLEYEPSKFVITSFDAKLNFQHNFHKICILIILPLLSIKKSEENYNSSK